jgi:hypothetical protein
VSIDGTAVASYTYDNYAITGNITHGNVTQITSYDSVQGALNQNMTYKVDPIVKTKNRAQ